MVLEKNQNNHLEIIGSNLYVDVEGIKNIPAKIDTGADSSAFWASDIVVKEDEVLYFKLFGKNSPFYTGEVLRRTDYKVVITRSSHGDEKLFYRTHIPIIINGHKIKTLCTLSDRSHNNFPILIGKRTIKNRFLVDVSKQQIIPSKNPKANLLNKEMKKNAVNFYKKYFTTSK